MVIGIVVYRVHAHDPKQAGCNGKLPVPVLFFSATATARLARKLPIGFDTFFAVFHFRKLVLRTNYVELGYISSPQRLYCKVLEISQALLHPCAS
jgi:hypothetical protein